MKSQKRKHPVMTPEWLRSFSGFENYSDEKLMKALETIRTLAHILLQSKPNQTHSCDEQPGIDQHIRERKTS